MNAAELYREIVMAESEGNEKRALKLIDQMLKDYPDAKEAELAKDVRFRINYKDAGVKRNSNTSLKTEYGTARTIIDFMSFFGWVPIALGSLVGFIGFTLSFADSELAPEALVGIPIIIASVFGAISGTFMLANAQLLRTSIDHADHSREILELLRKKL